MDPSDLVHLQRALAGHFHTPSPSVELRDDTLLIITLHDTTLAGIGAPSRRQYAREVIAFVQDSFPQIRGLKKIVVTFPGWHGPVPRGDSSGVRPTAARALGFLVLTRELATWGHASTDTLWEVARSNLPSYVTALFLQGLREANDDPSCLRGFDAKTEYVVVMDGCRGLEFSLSFFSAGRSFPNMVFGDSARVGIAKIYPPLSDGTARSQ